MVCFGKATFKDKIEIPIHETEVFSGTIGEVHFGPPSRCCPIVGGEAVENVFLSVKAQEFRAKLPSLGSSGAHCQIGANFLDGCRSNDSSIKSFYPCVKLTGDLFAPPFLAAAIE